MLESVVSIAIKAGQEILDEYSKQGDIILKSDNSPLTRADKRSHELIKHELFSLTPHIPLLSEEGKEINFTERSIWTSFWCVDPMDGTKEFLKRTGDFTVNIALIEDNRPVLGVIYAPAKGWIYTAIKGQGAFFYESLTSTGNPIRVRDLNKNALDVVASKDHAGPRVQAMLSKIPGATMKSVGSSIKFCMVADGQADVYYRDVPTFEWDTAAAQIIVEEAGGALLTESGIPLTYNKQDLRNPALITVGTQAQFWLGLIAE